MPRRLPDNHPVFDKAADKIGLLPVAEDVSSLYNVVTGMRLMISGLSSDEIAGADDEVQINFLNRIAEAIGRGGLLDGRLQPSLRRAPVAEIERVLGLYRDLYRGFTVKHFHEQLGKRHGYTLGCTVTKLHLHRAGLVTPARPLRRPTRMAGWGHKPRNLHVAAHHWGLGR